MIWVLEGTIVYNVESSKHYQNSRRSEEQPQRFYHRKSSPQYPLTYKSRFYNVKNAYDYSVPSLLI